MNELSRGFKGFLKKFYSHNVEKKDFKEWTEKLMHIETELELIPLLEEINSKETPETLRDLYSEVVNDQNKLKREKGEEIISERLKDLRGAVLAQLVLRNRSEATEFIVKGFMQDNFIYTTRDDIKAEVWIYKEGIYIPVSSNYHRILIENSLKSNNGQCMIE